MGFPKIAGSIPSTIFVLVLASPLFGEASFTGLGDLSGGIFWSQAFDLSANGSAVVGYGTRAAGPEAFRWLEGTMEGLGYLPGGMISISEARRLSADGAVVVGWSGMEAFRWENGVMSGLGSLPGGMFVSQAWAVSADGAIITGRSHSEANGETGYQAFRWENGVMSGLGDLPGGSFDSIGLSISADGLIIAGRASSESGSEAFRWENSVMSGLGDLPGGGFGSEARAISADGLVIVGWGTSDDGPEPFRWTTDTGMVGLDNLPGGDFDGAANAVSADGSLVVGESRTDSGGYEAFIWDAENQMRNLRTVLTDVFGLDLTGWTLKTAQAISTGGGRVTIVGWGTNPTGDTEGWMAHYPLVPPDFNKDGDVDAHDFEVFRACSTGPGIPYDPENLPPGCTLSPDNESIIPADLDRDGDVDQDDFAIFQRCYSGNNSPAEPAGMN